VDERPVDVVGKHAALARSEEQHITVGTPLYHLKLRLHLVHPQPLALHAPEDHHAVFVHQADLRPIRTPLDVGHAALIPVIDHLLASLVLVESPDDYVAEVVAARQLVVLLVPDNDLHLPLVVFKRLVYRHPPLACLRLVVLQLDDPQHALASADPDLPLPHIPGNRVDLAG